MRRVRFEHPGLKVIVQSASVERVLELATVQAHHIGVLFVDGDFGLLPESWSMCYESS